MQGGGLLPDWGRLQNFLGGFLKGKAGPLLYLSVMGVLLGVYALIFILFAGHGAAANTTSLVPWGVQITTYVYLVLIATGLAFVHFLGETFLGEPYRPFAVRILFLALFSALCGMGSLATELGHVERMFYFFITPNPTSPMWWMAVWYTLELVVLALELVYAKLGKHSTALSWAALVIGAFTVGTLGTLFGSAEARHAFYSAQLPLYFVVFALVTGSAVASIVAISQTKSQGSSSVITFFRKLMAASVGIALLFAIWRLIIGLYGISEGAEAFHVTLKSQVLYDILLAGVLPFLMALAWKRPSGIVLTSLWVLVTQFLVRYDLVASGFVVPVFRAYDIPDVIHYSPSYVEWFVVAASISLVVFLYLTADRIGYLTSSKKEA